MKKAYTLFCLFFTLFSFSSIAQKNQALEFKYIENKNAETSTAIFTILGVNSSSESLKITQAIQSIEGVVSFKIFYNRRCKLVFKNSSNITCELIRKSIQVNGADFDLNYVKPNNKLVFVELSDFKETHPINDYKPNPTYTYNYPADFPKMVDTGNPAEDKKKLALAKQKWIEDNPEKYKEITGFEYLDYSFRLDKK